MWYKVTSGPPGLRQYCGHCGAPLVVSSALMTSKPFDTVTGQRKTQNDYSVTIECSRSGDAGMHDRFESYRTMLDVYFSLPMEKTLSSITAVNVPLPEKYHAAKHPERTGIDPNGAIPDVGELTQLGYCVFLRNNKSGIANLLPNFRK